MKRTTLDDGESIKSDDGRVRIQRHGRFLQPTIHTRPYKVFRGKLSLDAFHTLEEAIAHAVEKYKVTFKDQE